MAAMGAVAVVEEPEEPGVWVAAGYGISLTGSNYTHVINSTANSNHGGNGGSGGSGASPEGTGGAGGAGGSGYGITLSGSHYNHLTTSPPVPIMAATEGWEGNGGNGGHRGFKAAQEAVAMVSLFPVLIITISTTSPPVPIMAATEGAGIMEPTIVQGATEALAERIWFLSLRFG